MNTPTSTKEMIEKSQASINYPISLGAKAKIIESLKQEIKSYGLTKESPEYKSLSVSRRQQFIKECGIMPSDPFRDYVFIGDNWDAFITDIFERMHNYGMLLVAYFEETEPIDKKMREDIIASEKLKDVEISETPLAMWDNISLEQVKEGYDILKKYLKAVEGLTRFWIEFIESKVWDSENFIEGHNKRCEDINIYLEHPLIKVTPFEKSFHLFYSEYITKLYLQDKSEQSKEKDKEIRKLSLRISALEKAGERDATTIKSLREATQKKVRETVSAPIPQPSKTEIQGRYLQETLRKLGYDIESRLSLEQWIATKQGEAIESKESEWEAVALEESHQAEVLRQQISNKDAYITYLEHQLNGTSVSIEKHYQEARFKNEQMSTPEMLVYMADYPIMAEHIKPLVINLITRLTSRISGLTFSSTRNNNVGAGSGHTVNHVIVRLLRFLQSNLEQGNAQYLSISWKQIVANYTDDTGLGQHKNCKTSFPPLLRHLPEEAGNIGNFQALQIGIQVLEKEKDLDFKKLCDFLSAIFNEEMMTLRRQILAMKEKQII